MRRIFIYTLLTLLALPTCGLVPSTAAAADKMVAVILTGDLPRYNQAHDSFIKILQKGGMTEDKVEVFVQRPSADPMSLANAVRKAVGVGVDLIVTYGGPATMVAKKQAKGIPLLFVDVGDPVALGIVKTLTTTGGDLSGVSSMTPIETLLKNFVTVHQTKSLGFIYSKQDIEAAFQFKQLQKASSQFGFKVVSKEVKTCKEVNGTFKSIGGSIDALYIPHCAMLEPAVAGLVDTALQVDIPTITQVPGLTEKGALMSLVADPVEQGQLAGVHALQVLNGLKIFTLPVRTPKKVEFVVNMKSAKALGLQVPIGILEGATRVIK